MVEKSYVGWSYGRVELCGMVVGWNSGRVGWWWSGVMVRWGGGRVRWW